MAYCLCSGGSTVSNRADFVPVTGLVSEHSHGIYAMISVSYADSTNYSYLVKRSRHLKENI